jgi:hypothetical protein
MHKKLRPYVLEAATRCRCRFAGGNKSGVLTAEERRVVVAETSEAPKFRKQKCDTLLERIKREYDSSYLRSFGIEFGALLLITLAVCNAIMEALCYHKYTNYAMQANVCSWTAGSCRPWRWSLAMALPHPTATARGALSKEGLSSPSSRQPTSTASWSSSFVGKPH